MTNTLSQIPHLGNGIGFRPELKSFIYLNRDKIDFVEIIADHYIDVPDAKLEELMLLKKHFTVIPHAINLSLGSAHGLDKTYVKKLGALVDLVAPPYWSEHVSYTQAHGYDTGHLSPIVYNAAFLDIMAGNIKATREFIKTPLILENITYHVELPGQDYSDADFLNRLCETTKSGLLLDITNLYINSKNFGFDPLPFIDQLDKNNIIQLHYVGYETGGGQIIDTHAAKTQEEIFALMDYVYSRHQPKGVLLERDERYDALDEITADLERAKKITSSFTAP